MVRFRDIMGGKKAGHEKHPISSHEPGPEIQRKETSPAKEKREPELVLSSSEPELESITESRSLRSPESIYNEALILIKRLLDNPEEGKERSDEIRAIVRELVQEVTSGHREILFLTQEQSPSCYLYCHSVNVTILALYLGLAMDYDKEELLILGLAAFLHDIGMSKCISIVQKKGKLTHGEFNIVQRHSEDGKNWVKNIDTLPHRERVGTIIWQIHERINGKGYPMGLRGDQIDEMAKVISLVDTYETLTHPRPYREKISPPQVMEMLLEMKDEIFDAELIRTMVEQFSLYPLGSYVRLNTGDIGKVVGINKEYPTRPQVELLFNGPGKKVEHRTLNLAQAPAVQITEVMDEEELILEQKE